MFDLLSHESQQLRLNCCAALYALSCAGRRHCREVSTVDPIPTLLPFLEPAIGRTTRDDQLQTFAALFLVNVIYAIGRNLSREKRAEVRDGLSRAYDDAQESQAREIITLGLKKLKKLDSRKAALKKKARSIAGGIKRSIKNFYA